MVCVGRMFGKLSFCVLWYHSTSVVASFPQNTTVEAYVSTVNPSTPSGATWVRHAQSWASECPDVKNYKWWLNPAWHRMLYSCTHVAPLGVKGLTGYIHTYMHANPCSHSFFTDLCHWLLVWCWIMIGTQCFSGWAIAVTHNFISWFFSVDSWVNWYFVTAVALSWLCATVSRVSSILVFCDTVRICDVGITVTWR